MVIHPTDHITLVGGGRIIRVVKVHHAGDWHDASPRGLGRDGDVVIQSDSSAAIVITTREELGCTRHTQVQYLRLQQEVTGGNLKVKTIHTKSNIADLLTKHLRTDLLKDHLEDHEFQDKEKLPGTWKSSL